MSKTKINVKLKEDQYSVHLVDNILDPSLIKKYISDRQIMIIYDNNLSIEKVRDFSSMINSYTKFETISMGIVATEDKKSQETLNDIHNRLIEEKFSRDCLLIGMGGGIVCDISGFAAATYLRGVDFVLIPTSLLAQVDASVGGKTAINHALGKNLIGAFHQPKIVLIDTSFLETLPKKEIICGLVEMIKHSLISDQTYFIWIKENINFIKDLDQEIVKEAVQKSIQIKADIVSKDEKELGLRAILNFGHTFGHAIELLGKFKDYSHGEAVALGILPALELSKKFCNLQDEDIEKIKDLLEESGVNTKLLKPFNSQEIYQAMQLDKKKKGDELNFIVIERIGSAKKLNKILKQDVLNAIESSLLSK